MMSEMLENKTTIEGPRLDPKVRWGGVDGFQFWPNPPPSPALGPQLDLSINPHISYFYFVRCGIHIIMHPWRLLSIHLISPTPPHPALGPGSKQQAPGSNISTGVKQGLRVLTASWLSIGRSRKQLRRSGRRAWRASRIPQVKRGQI